MVKRNGILKEMIYCQVEARPKNDDGYFEQMTKAVFRSGFNWDVVKKKWPAFQKAFVNFSAKKVAKFNEKDIDRLMKDEEIVKNLRKIVATIDNAKKILEVKKEYGSFRDYLKEGSKDGEEHLAKIIVKQFSYIGDSMIVSFLRSVGEEMPEMNKKWVEQHTKRTGG